MALLPVCSTLNWKADGKLPLKAVVQLETSKYVSAMIRGLKTFAPDRDSSEAPEFVVCQCPACKMLSWQKGQTQEQRVCPFCSSVQPDYLIKIVPETVTAIDPEPGGFDVV